MSEIKDASFLKFVPVEQLSRSHGKQGSFGTIFQAQLVTQPVHLTEPAHLQNPDKANKLILDLERPVSSLFPLPHRLCGTRRKGNACVRAC